jgi:hypothetical protein
VQACGFGRTENSVAILFLTNSKHSRITLTLSQLYWGHEQSAHCQSLTYAIWGSHAVALKHTAFCNVTSCSQKCIEVYQTRIQSTALAGHNPPICATRSGSSHLTLKGLDPIIYASRPEPTHLPYQLRIQSSHAKGPGPNHLRFQTRTQLSALTGPNPIICATGHESSHLRCQTRACVDVWLIVWNQEVHKWRQSTRLAEWLLISYLHLIGYTRKR